VTIGRHCLLAAQIGLAGSLTIGDNVALGAKVGINNHLHIGDGAQVTAMSAVKDDIPANGRWGAILPSRPSNGSARSLRWSVWSVMARPIRARGASDGRTGQI